MAGRSMKEPRYAIGIDLGTTHCTLAWIDLADDTARARVLAIPQLDTPRTVRSSPLLPSFFCYATPGEIAGGQFDPLKSTPLEEAPGYFIGALARERMGDQPGRVIHSAKSWLAHAGIDREARLLPFGSDEIPPELKLSPVEASSAYLGYLRAAWNHLVAHDDPESALEAQRVVITVPASFDEAAQALTREAARLAGYPAGVRLLEEPQAAFYAWLDHAAGDAGCKETLAALAQRRGTILVCDIGGGTTDFSLFRAGPAAAAGERPAIERIATSDHLLLGGDNIDLALAHALERKLKPDPDAQLSRRQWGHLLPQARRLKETVLAAAEATGDAKAPLHVAVPGEGAALFAASLDAAITAAEVRAIVLDGFFPLTAVDELPRARRMGLLEVGLPYASDTAVSRHLAAFLRDRLPVDAVLFAGGSLHPPVLRERLLALIESWQGRSPLPLALPNLDIAIAEGAARYAALSADARARIRGGYPHSVYVELQRDAAETAARLVCVLPQGCEAGARVELAAPTFELTLNRPVRFAAYTSNRRVQDVPGDLVPLDRRAFHPLPPLQTTIVQDDANFSARKAAADSVAVLLESGITEVGMLELALIDRSSGVRWELAFNLRRPVAHDDADGDANTEAGPAGPGVGAKALASAQARIALYFGAGQALDSSLNVKALPRELERILGLERLRWSTGLLRSLWPALHPGITRRGRSLAHESAWLYLAGFVLRPGYGSDLDAWEVEQLWECFDLGLVHRKEASARANWWMMWRRIAGGLPAAAQERLYDSAFPELRRPAGEVVECTRLLGSLERVAVERRLELAALLFDRVVAGKARSEPHVHWALARLLSRTPLYTAADSVVPAAVVEEAFGRVEARDWKQSGLEPLVAVFAAACRRIDLRSLDVDDGVRRRVLDKLGRSGATMEQLRCVRECTPVTGAQWSQLFGEQLPAGLRLSAG
ncbi:MAG: Hsp70 family protein [Betaproteobacteria bacterium]|nr:Hsp70 family protein [Betaproteobacteria bacterium]